MGVFVKQDDGWLNMETGATPPSPGPLGAQYADFSNAATGTFTDADGDWKYTTFTADGTLTVTQPGILEVLLVAGGAGGGKAAQGGGGAGGVIHGRLYIAGGDVTVTVGAGGNGGTSPTNGEDSALGMGAGHGITAVGGGFGKSGGSQMGGSGGGGQGNPSGDSLPGRGILYQGNDGGYPGQSVSPNISSCGGGGAATAGGAAVSVTVGGNGGEGLEIDGFGSNPTGAYAAGTYRVADGGGGGASGTGGAAGGPTGGAGGSGNLGEGELGQPFTGGGGGGGGSTWSGGQGPGGPGGSGIVIVKTMVLSTLRKNVQAKRDSRGDDE